MRNIAPSKHLSVNGVQLQPEVKHCRHLAGISEIPGASLPWLHHHGNKSCVRGVVLVVALGANCSLGYPYHPPAASPASSGVLLPKDFLKLPCWSNVSLSQTLQGFSLFLPSQLI